ncbi:MAG: glycosyltransferase [Flavobacteriales bacterium]
MKLSVIIPCYNMEKYLATCLDSLLNQEIDPTNYEIIIVNDESKDATLDIAKSYAKKHRHIHIIDKKNAGVGAARNSGFDQAKGTYVYFLDPDDYLAKNVLGKLLFTIEEHNLDILVFHSLEVKAYTNLTSNKCDTITDEISIKDGISYIASVKFQNEVWRYFINREFMVNTGIRFIEGKWMEDAILTAQLFCKAERMAYIDLDAHRYRILPTSAMRNKSPEHYKKVIYDNANAAMEFVTLIQNVPQNHPKAKECIRRLKTRQQSWVFFFLVRFIK